MTNVFLPHVPRGLSSKERQKLKKRMPPDRLLAKAAILGQTVYWQFLLRVHASQLRKKQYLFEGTDNIIAFWQ